MRAPVFCAAPAAYPPGDPRLAPEGERAARLSPALLLRNHGAMSIGRSPAEAAAPADGRGRRLDHGQVAELRGRFR
jgi:hypothetical protein